jgi:methylmalonyl-CoA/ethylmalonyl-CoA epimerase
VTDDPLSVPAGAARAIRASIPGVRRIHHVGIVVHDLDAALERYRDDLGLPFESVMDRPEDGIRLAFLTAGPSKIELLQPMRPDTGVARYLAARGEGMHHLCLEVADLAHALTRLAGNGFELSDAVPRRGAEGPVAFVHPRSTNGALIELIEAPGGPAWEALGYR